MPANLQEAKLPFASPGHYGLLFPRSPPKLSPGGAALNQAHPNAGGKVVVEIAIDVDLQQNSRGYAGSPVPVGTTPLKPNQPKSSSSTNNTDYSNLASCPRRRIRRARCAPAGNKRCRQQLLHPAWRVVSGRDAARHRGGAGRNTAPGHRAHPPRGCSLSRLLDCWVMACWYSVPASSSCCWWIRICVDAELPARMDQAGRNLIRAPKGDASHVAEWVVRTQGFESLDGGNRSTVGACQQQSGRF